MSGDARRGSLVIMAFAAVLVLLQAVDIGRAAFRDQLEEVRGFVCGLILLLRLWPPVRDPLDAIRLRSRSVTRHHRCHHPHHEFDEFEAEG